MCNEPLTDVMRTSRCRQITALTFDFSKVCSGFQAVDKAMQLEARGRQASDGGIVLEPLHVASQTLFTTEPDPPQPPTMPSHDASVLRTFGSKSAYFLFDFLSCLLTVIYVYADYDSSHPTATVHLILVMELAQLCVMCLQGYYTPRFPPPANRIIII